MRSAVSQSCPAVKCTCWRGSPHNSKCGNNRGFSHLRLARQSSELSASRLLVGSKSGLRTFLGCCPLSAMLDLYTTDVYINYNTMRSKESSPPRQTSQIPGTGIQPGRHREGCRSWVTVLLSATPKIIFNENLYLPLKSLRMRYPQSTAPHRIRRQLN